MIGSDTLVVRKNNLLYAHILPSTYELSDSRSMCNQEDDPT
jgi:hypothetical protein